MAIPPRPLSGSFADPIPAVSAAGSPGAPGSVANSGLFGFLQNLMGAPASTGTDNPLGGVMGRINWAALQELIGGMGVPPTGGEPAPAPAAPAANPAAAQPFGSWGDFPLLQRLSQMPAVTAAPTPASGLPPAAAAPVRTPQPPGPWRSMNNGAQPTYALPTGRTGLPATPPASLWRTMRGV